MPSSYNKNWVMVMVHELLNKAFETENENENENKSKFQLKKIKSF